MHTSHGNGAEEERKSYEDVFEAVLTRAKSACPDESLLEDNLRQISFLGQNFLCGLAA
jgi:hypothetical protein